MNKNNINTKYYRIVFLLVMFSTLLLWLSGVFRDGQFSEQLDIFFRRFGDFLADFTNVVGYSAQLSPYTNTIYTGLGEKAYPPLTYSVLYLFSRLVDIQKYYQNNYFLNMYTEPLFLFMFILTRLMIILFLYEILRFNFRTNRFTSIMLSFLLIFSRPIINSFERGNTILLTMIFCIIFILDYDSKNPLKAEYSLISLALAASLKITPAILGLLLLIEKKNFGKAARAIIYGLFFFFIPFFFLHGGKRANIRQLITNIQLNLGIYPNTDGVTFESCIRHIGLNLPPNSISIIKYIILSLLIICLLIHHEKWIRAMAICLFLVIAPGHSGDYCVLYMIPSYILFLNTDQHRPSDFLILFGIILTLQPFQTSVVKNLLNFHFGLLLLSCLLSIYTVIRLLNIISKNKKILPVLNFL